MTNATDERRARALCRKEEGCGDPEWVIDQVVEANWPQYLPDAAVIRASDAEAGMVLVPRNGSHMILTTLLREYVGGERYARDYEYCDAQLAPKLKAAWSAMIAAHEGDE